MLQSNGEYGDSTPTALEAQIEHGWLELHGCSSTSCATCGPTVPDECGHHLQGHLLSPHVSSILSSTTQQSELKSSKLGSLISVVSGQVRMSMKW